MLKFEIRKGKLKKIILLIVICLGLFSGCSQEEKTVSETVDMPNISVQSPSKPNEVMITDNELNKINKSVPTLGEKRAEIPRLIADNSKVTTMYDGYGNKIETRYFSNHPNLSSLTLKTFADGRQTVVVFGQNGERKTVPPEMFNQVLSASGNEIANKAGIYLTKRENESNVSTAKIENTLPKPNSPEQQTDNSVPQAQDNANLIQNNEAENTLKEKQVVDNTPHTEIENKKISPKIALIRKIEK